ncbi:MAG: hypothetical protein RL662_2469, partial [Bacteroidota bacterium]
MEFIYIAIILMFSVFMIAWFYRSASMRVEELKNDNQLLKKENELLGAKQLQAVEESADLKATLYA